jgi:hypothetical protein
VEYFVSSSLQPYSLDGTLILWPVENWFEIRLVSRSLRRCFWVSWARSWGLEFGVWSFCKGLSDITWNVYMTTDGITRRLVCRTSPHACLIQLKCCVSTHFALLALHLSLCGLCVHRFHSYLREHAISGGNIVIVLSLFRLL